ncbi:MAG: anti-FecI sigma factor, FecR [Chitinophagaceae bacterium]|nr:anti-FecI sigma factor, FecR [Chitinophagaceae bacterium]
MEERFLYLVRQELAQSITKSERLELQNILHTNKEFNQLYQSVFAKKDLTEFELLEAEQAYASQAVRIQVNEEFEEEQRTASVIRPAKFKYARFAIVFLAVATIIQFYFFLPAAENKVTSKNEIATRKGSKSHILLPDGTSVWLNADSKIIYPANFTGDSREVQLTGEAFFDVAKNPRKPFIIHTGTMDVKVLGTVFNVRSYPRENTTEASLIHGMIEITLHGKEKKNIILKPNEKLTVLNSDASYIKTSSRETKKSLDATDEEMPLLALTKIHFNKRDSSNAETSWVYNKLSFDNENMGRVFSKIEQWYNIEIVIEDENIKARHFTATFENKSLNEVMEALQVALNFKYQEKEGRIIIR